MDKVPMTAEGYGALETEMKRLKNEERPAVIAAIAEARELLAGEREGLKITAAQSGGVDFFLGNSPREYTSDRVMGKTIITTTTNGTRALRACISAEAVVVGSFLNLAATAKWLTEQTRRLVLVCAGTAESAAAAA